ncbi:tyrosine-protein phosphatase non-receptor type 13-like isoform X2 [Pecten maximus]|uniref:tyrosine-protein phosphatase non-receptor type 13-like isoform X2 n=1 Tax=Pecten maximus TaxID=6579 RepID=UPI0014587419|nr:tyrosine-protein phosphatase non-receptor type 13-like isoform X2 [Pecten maximus]
MSLFVMFCCLNDVLRRPYDTQWTWGPLQKARRKARQPVSRMDSSDQRGEVILRNLAHDLLSEYECEEFKQILHQFKQTQSVATLCHQVKPLINTTEKLLLLVELSSRIPRNLQEDFHRICSIQFANYETYLRIYSHGNSLADNPRVIAQDSSGKFQIVSNGSEKKFMVNSNNYKNYTDINSQHGTSVTSGIYSEHDDESLKPVDDTSGDVFLWGSGNYGNVEAKKTNNNVKPSVSGTVRRIFLARREDGSLGLGIQGGKEYGTEISVNVLDPEGPAASQGVVLGDTILEVNGTDFRHLTHAEAVTLIRNAWNIIILVQSGGRRRSHHSQRRVSEHLQVVDLEVLVYPSVDGRLGCATNRRNKNKVLVVRSVDANSPAYKAGIVAGDLITKIDGVDIRSLTERQITSLTRTKRLMICIRRGVKSPEVGSPKPGKRERPDSSDRRSGSTYGQRSNKHDRPETDLERFTRAFGTMDVDSEEVDGGNMKKTNQNNKRNSTKDGNWMLTPKEDPAPKFFHRKEFITTPNVQSRPRADSHGAAQFERRSRSHGRDAIQVVWGGGVRRYVRSRSQSPHHTQRSRRRSRSSSRHEQDIMTAIQMGVEKRQRALRLSLYQTPDNSDLDWEL